MAPHDKLLEHVDGIPLIRQRALCCLASDADSVRVVLPPDRPERDAVLDGLNLEIIHNSGSELGMAHSLKCGIRGITTDEVLIVLADLPDLTASDLNKVISAAKVHPSADILRGADTNGRPGHPVLMRSSLFKELSELEGDTGAQPVLRRYKTETVLVPIGPAALRDLDTPEDWVAWRNDQSK